LSVSASGSINTLGVLSAFLSIVLFLGVDWQEAKIKLAITTAIAIHD
jgi:hypothetical protein